MTRTKLGLLGLCAVVVGMMAMSVSAAQASLFDWLVLENGVAKLVTTPLPLTVELETTHATLLTHLLKLSISITCTGFTTTGISVESEGKLTEGGKIKFTGCEAYENGVLGTKLNCKVHTTGTAAGTIESKEGKGKLELHESSPGITEIVTRIEPKTGTTFATILTEGCVLPESNPVSGVLYVKDCEGLAETHQLKHLIIEQKSLTKLFVGADTAEHLETSIDGSAWAKLNNGLTWGAEHNK